MTAQNLINILEAISHNTDVPLEKLKVAIKTPEGYICWPDNYNTDFFEDWTAVIDVVYTKAV